MHPLREEGMFQRFRGSNPLVGVQRYAALEEVDELVELSRLRIVHAARRSQEARTKIPGWLDHG